MNDGEVKNQAKTLPADELNRLADFFSLLIAIDKRTKANERSSNVEKVD